MATNNDDASSSADASSADASSAYSPNPFLEDEHLGILDEKQVGDMKRKASVNYYDWPIEKKGSKAVKKKRSNSDNECAKCWDLLALQGLLLIERAGRTNQANRLRDVIKALRDEADTLRDEVNMLRNEATVREMEYNKSNC